MGRIDGRAQVLRGVEARVGEHLHALAGRDDAVLGLAGEGDLLGEARGREKRPHIPDAGVLSALSPSQDPQSLCQPPLKYAGGHSRNSDPHTAVPSTRPSWG